MLTFTNCCVSIFHTTHFYTHNIYPRQFYTIPLSTLNCPQYTFYTSLSPLFTLIPISTPCSSNLRCIHAPVQALEARVECVCVDWGLTEWVSLDHMISVAAVAPPALGHLPHQVSGAYAVHLARQVSGLPASCSTKAVPTCLIRLVANQVTSHLRPAPPGH